MPEGSVGVVLSQAAATAAAQALNKARTELSTDPRTAKINETRTARLMEAELALRAALMDLTLNTPDEQEDV